MGTPRDHGSDICLARNSFDAGDQWVRAIYGFAERGCWLRFVVV